MVQETTGEPEGCAGSASSGLERRTNDGSQPRIQHLKYKDVLADLELIYLLPGTQGRKPHAGVPASRELSAERSPTHDWANWWIQVGGFQASFVIGRWIGMRVGSR